MKEDVSLDRTDIGSNLPGGIAWIRYPDGKLFIGPMYGLPLAEGRRRDALKDVTDPEIRAVILSVRLRTSLILNRVGQINEARRTREKIIH